MHSPRVPKIDKKNSIKTPRRILRRNKKRRIWNPVKRRFRTIWKGAKMSPTNCRRPRDPEMRKSEVKNISEPNRTSPRLRSSISVNSLSSVVYLGTFKKVPQLIILDENDDEKQDKDSRAALKAPSTLKT